MSLTELNDFSLAGGTALALQIGHRISYDLDFFGSTNEPIERIIESIPADLTYQEMHRTRNVLTLNIENIKVDFVNYNYPLIDSVSQSDGIRLHSLKDIGAMKLEAIKGRGRKRDFFDLYFLLDHFPLDRLLALHKQKFGQDTSFLILKSLVYFNDAEDDPSIQLLGDELDWKSVKSQIQLAVAKY